MADDDDAPRRLTPAERAQQKRDEKLADLQEQIDTGRMKVRQLSPEEMEEHAKRRQEHQEERGRRRR